MKQKIKQTLVVLLSLALVAGSLAGCGKSAEDKKAAGKGRYVEEDVELPIKEGETIISLSKSAEGNPLIFASSGVEINRYECIEGKWSETSLEWIQNVFNGQTVYMVDAEETSEGTQVVLAMDDNGQCHLARGKNGASGESMNIPYLVQETEYGYPGISDLLIDGEGNYWMQDVYQSKVAAINPDTLETIFETETVRLVNTGMTNKMMARGDDGSIAVKTAEGTYTVYSGKEPAESDTLKVEEGKDTKFCGDGSLWYGVSQDGLSSNRSGNDISEMLMDGGFGSMGSPVNTPVSIISLSAKEFYVLYSQDTAGTYSVKRYVYDKNIATVPAHTLTVFGMSENATIRQAITEFQKKNTEVNIVFRTSAKEGGGVTTDDIRTLNTELLSGNGADVLLLDGLPIDSYIEKGILEDMTDLIEELMKQDKYLETIMKNTAEKDGKIYGLPMKFGVPILYGSTQVQEALESLDTLSAYMEANPDASVFGLSDYNYIKNILFLKYQDEIMGTDGKINQEKLVKLLELEAQIAKNAKADEYEGSKFMNWDGSTADTFDTFTNPVGMAVAKHPDAVATSEIISVTSMMLPYEIMKQLNTEPVSFQDMYNPIGITAINKNSKQKELAKEFVKYVFSETVQSALTDDGLPVLDSALQSKVKETSEVQMGATIELEGEAVNIIASYPPEEKIQALADLSRTLTTPIRQDRVIWNLYRETAGTYLEGSIDAAEAAETIAQKVDTYLAE